MFLELRGSQALIIAEVFAMRGGDKMKNKGFTLVELLVVIAIIGVLSAIAVVNLNSARNKGVDAARKSNLSSLPAGAEVYYDSGLTYEGWCDSSDVSVIEATLDDNATFVCADTATGWAALVTLTDDVPAATRSVFCVDYMGIVAATSSYDIVDDTDVTCYTD